MPKHELKYSITVKTEEEDEAIEYINGILRKLFKSDDKIVDFDGPL